MAESLTREREKNGEKYTYFISKWRGAEGGWSKDGILHPDVSAGSPLLAWPELPAMRHM